MFAITISRLRYKKSSYVMCSLLFSAVVMASPILAYVQKCKDGICVSTSSSWDAQRKKHIRYLYVSGLPRTKQDYATQFWQIRGLPYPYPDQIEAWPNKISSGIEFEGSRTISVQACRRRGALIVKTYCTPWVAFNI
jgi:hypothetical protein